MIAILGLGSQVDQIQAGDYVWSENGTVINTTENHPFYVEEKGWCAAAELEDGDVLRTQDGETETVEDVWTEQLSEAVRVYNLEIEESHTYYVSVDGVLVHNRCKKGGYDEYGDYATSERIGKQNGNAPRNNKEQKEQVDAIARLLKLSKDDREGLHRIVSHQGYDFQDMLKIAKDFFGGNKWK